MREVKLNWQNPLDLAQKISENYGDEGEGGLLLFRSDHGSGARRGGRVGGPALL